MDSNRVLEVIRLYRNRLVGINIAKKAFPHNMELPSPSDALMHVQDMLDMMEHFVDEGREEKSMRWLGFVQGVLWCSGIYTLDELKNHNRSAG